MSDSRFDAWPPPAAAAATLRQLIMGFRITQLIHVAAKLDLADRLLQGPKTPRELAEEADVEPHALHRALRALASLGIFAETADGSFVLTPLAQPLRTDIPGSLHGVACLYGEDYVWQVYGRMLHSVETGQPAFEHVHGQPFYGYLHDNPEAATYFNRAMSGFSAEEATAILAAFDFSEVARVVDVGGGYGTLLTALLQTHAHLSGVVFDLAPVVAGAERRCGEAGLGARATCIAGDFFAEVPGGGDLYLLKSVLHNWDDDAVLRILRSCRRAMADHARLMVIERVIPPGNGPAEAKLFDINMLVMLGGQERTEWEYYALFQAAGFSLARVIPTRSHLSLLEGVPAAA